MLSRVSVGWQWLSDTLNGIIDAVNAQKIIPSATVGVNQSPTGIILTASALAAPQPQQGGGGSIPNPPSGTAGWQQIQVVDANCNIYTMWVWGTSPQ